MGDVIGVADADGNLALEYYYDAWGDNFTARPDSCDYDGKTGWNGAYRLYNDNPIKYRGYYFDHAIGMYYLQSRYFHTDINRFFNADDPDIARESKDVPVGMNLFAYCNNDPVNKVDPDGRLSIKTGFSKILNKIKYRIQDYFANLIVKKNGIIRISVTVIAAGLIFIVSMIVAKLVYKGVTSLLHKVVGYVASKHPGRLVDALRIVVNQMQRNLIFKFVGQALIKKSLKLPSALGTFASDLRDNILFSGLLNRYVILNRISLVVSAFSSIGGFLANIFDAMDGHWDGYLSIRYSKKKGVVHI